MLLYNVTCNVEASVAEAWAFYMKAIHMPEVVATGCFERSQLCRLLEQEDDGSVTYAAQYYCPDAATLEKYLQEFAPALRDDMSRRFKDQFVAFRTVLEIVD